MSTEGYSKIESLNESERAPGGEYHRWMAEIQAAEKELDKWKRNSRKIVKEYRAERIEVSGVDPAMERRYNLFASNVNILQTSLMNQTPQPTVNREFKDPSDDVARVAAYILERAISAHNNRNFKTANILKQVVQDMLVPGAGISWHTYHAEIEHRVMQPDTQTIADEGAEGASPVPQAEALEYDEVVGEELRDEYVYWEDLLWSPARCWDEVRWIARKTYLTRDQLVERFGNKGKRVPLDYSPKRNDANSVESKNIVFQQAVVYEIWDKPSEQVIWVSKGMEDILDQKDDFLELDDFFPCPQPLVSTMSNGQYIPIPDFHYARDQYRELNEINTRLGLLVRACRVAGVYDKAAGQLQSLLSNAAENTLVPVDQWAAFAEKGGIKGSIDWIPLEQIVATIDQLLKNREDVKNQIYEITGMSDIIRGASKASETLGAQKIKAQFASMRIQERQKNVVQYCSSVFDIQIQLMRKHMDVQEIARLAQVQFMAEEPQLVQQALQLIKTPEFILRCRVDSDTLSDIDFQAEKQDRMEYMMTITNYLKEVLPTMQNDPLMGPFLMQLLQFSLAGFKIGKKFEGELDRTFAALSKQLQTPKPPQPSPEEQKAQAEIELMRQEGQFKAQERQENLNFKRQENQLKIAGKVQEAQVEGQIRSQKAAQEQQLGQAKMWQQLHADRVRAQSQAINAAAVPPDVPRGAAPGGQGGQA